MTALARVSEILRGKQADVLKIDASATVFDAIKKIVEQNVGSILVTATATWSGS